MCLSKSFVLRLVLMFVVLNMLLVGFCVAPVTVPENPHAGPEIVSVEVNNNPIWVPPTYSSPDPYTGEVTQITAGHYTRSGSISVTIKNIPFTPYVDEEGHDIDVYYCIFSRSVFTGVWVTFPDGVEYQSDSDYTCVTILYQSGGGMGIFIPTFLLTMDFRVQAVTGYYSPAQKASSLTSWQYVDPVFEGVGSEWTEFTITMPPFDSEPGISYPNIQYPSDSLPRDPINSYLILIPVMVCVMVVSIVIIMVYFRKIEI